MRPKATWVAIAAAFGCCLSACRVEESDSSPISLLERAAPAIATPVALANETRKALSVDLASRLEFDIRIPEAPVLSFAIGASSRDRPTLLAPVVFRVVVGDTEVFREQIRRAQGGRWFPREVDLGPWAGKSIRVVLESLRGEGGIEGAESHVVAHWGNPVATAPTPSKISIRNRHGKKRSTISLSTQKSAAISSSIRRCLRRASFGKFFGATSKPPGNVEPTSRKGR